ncbi:hypothetical protein WMY93_011555 [Mugilogobius chulae]|uniref:DUF393 domain-containing protein n=1 Tax=Mugilogobius chulae TaxID=88201 RepID=A0AAW0PCZ0_9GOBI
MNLVRSQLNSGLAIRAILCRLQLRTSHTSPTSAAAPVKVLYDGLCPICVTEIRFLQFIQRKKSDKLQKAMEEMHVIDEKNMVHRGVPAFFVMYSAVGLGWMGRLLMWPPIRPLMDKSYDIFARNRLKWTGRGAECTTGRCERKLK